MHRNSVKTRRDPPPWAREQLPQRAGAGKSEDACREHAAPSENPKIGGTPQPDGCAGREILAWHARNGDLSREVTPGDVLNRQTVRRKHMWTVSSQSSLQASCSSAA